jgi:hypothetical protein
LESGRTLSYIIHKIEFVPHHFVPSRPTIGFSTEGTNDSVASSVCVLFQTQRFTETILSTDHGVMKLKRIAPSSPQTLDGGVTTGLADGGAVAKE